MKLPCFLFLVSLAMSLIVGLVLIRGEPGEFHGVEHAEFPTTMQQGGSGQLRHDDLRWLGWAFGSLQITFFVSCLLLGIKPAARSRWPFLLGGLLYLAIFTLLAVADFWYAHQPPSTLVLGFPLPTALMIYGLWGAPCVFMLFYMLQFDRWILTPEDLQRFESSLRARPDEPTSGE